MLSSLAFPITDNKSCPLACDRAGCWSFESPCEGKTCEGHPEARCISNYCNDCHYYFVDSNYTRISGCGNCAALEPESQNKTKDECPDVCPHRRKLCYLPRTPCQASLGCPSHPNATCVDDYCNGCNHYYVNENGTRISGCGSCADLKD